MLKASSVPDDEEPPVYKSGIGSYMTTPGGKPATEMVPLNTGSKAWRVFLPIEHPTKKNQPIGLVRTYCDLERWEVVWRQCIRQTWKLLPPVLLGEFIILWIILGAVLEKALEDLHGSHEQTGAGRCNGSGQSTSQRRIRADRHTLQYNGIRTPAGYCRTGRSARGDPRLKFQPSRSN